MRVLIGVCLAVSAIGLVGCGKSAEGESAETADSAKSKSANSDRGGVAVVDLDEVAKRLGKQAEMDDLIKRRRMAYSSHLATVQAKYEKHIETKTKEYGETPNTDQIRTLNAIRQAAVIKYSKEKQAAAVGLQQYRIDLVKQLRAQVAPVAEKISRARGFDIVIPKDQSLLLTVSPTADITETVIEQMMKGKPKPLVVPKDVKPAPMPPKAGK